MSERLPTFPVSIKNFKTIPEGETELFDKAFPGGKPVFAWFNESVNGKTLKNPAPLLTCFEKYYSFFPAVGSGRNLKSNFAKVKSALAASEAKNAASDAKYAALQAKFEESQNRNQDPPIAANPSTIVEKSATK